MTPTTRSQAPWSPPGALLVFTIAVSASCSHGGSSRDTNSGAGGVGGTLRVVEVANGFGTLIPHRAREVDANGQPTGQLVALRSLADLAAHVRPSNPVLAPPPFPTTAVLPNGAPGNQFFIARFSEPVDAASVFDFDPSGSGLTSAVSVTSLDPVSGVTLPIPGRVFIGGATSSGPPTGTPPALSLRQWVAYDEGLGRLVALVPEAQSFPGVASPVDNPRDLVAPSTVVFVADSDGDLDTLETFPTQRTLRFRVTNTLRSVGGDALEEAVLAATTVGPDEAAPEVGVATSPPGAPRISPGNGDLDVDPRTSIRVEFSEPVQPYSVGVLRDTGPPVTSSSIALQFGPPSRRTTMPFSVLPVSPFDLSTYDLYPAFFFPGDGPELGQCGVFSRVDVTVTPGTVEDHASNPDPGAPGQTIPNTNLLGAATFFETGEGPGIVNAPVLPDAIYVARVGSHVGLSVVDLNGFGGGTGLPNDPVPVVEREKSKYPFNPNVLVNFNIRPSLTAGACTIDGGSAGVFTLTLDSSLDDRVVRAPIVADVADMHVGHALDGVFNNASAPFGCLAQGGDPCALPGLKQISTSFTGLTTLVPVQPGQFGALPPGYENLISWAPHPNPPPLVFPPLCTTPFLAGQEPSSVDNEAANVLNLLIPGDAFGDPLGPTPIPPTGLLAGSQNAFFVGPSVAPTPSLCQPYQIRQQVGHFLYVVDRQRSEVVVLNSNRMTVVDRIALPDPTSLAMSPNLDVLGVTNQGADAVSFIDTDPSSPTFHRVIKSTAVGSAPRGIAFDPFDEDVLVCNEGSSSVSVISVATLEVRKVVEAHLSGPFEVCVTPRQVPGYSFGRNVYFAYILNRTGEVAVFESGPDGTTGWGYDDVLGVVPFLFQNPKAIQFDRLNTDTSVYVVHEGPIDVTTGQPGALGEGAVSRLGINAAIVGQLPLQLSGSTTPIFRDMSFRVAASFGASHLSGIPVDLAFDVQRNLGGMQAPATQFSAGPALPANGKQVLRAINGVHIKSDAPRFLFVSVPNAGVSGGVIDVLALGSAGSPRQDTNPYLPGVQSIEVPGVGALADYFRQ